MSIRKYRDIETEDHGSQHCVVQKKQSKQLAMASKNDRNYCMCVSNSP